MTRNDVVKLMTMVRLAWPHSNIDNGQPEQAVALWHSFLHDVATADGESAVRELISAGGPHAPVVGVLVNTVARRQTDAPDFDEAWAESKRLIRKCGLNRKPDPDLFSHPAVAAWAIPAWRELCLGPAEGVDGDTTHKAQQRGAYQAAAARTRRDRALHIVGAPREGGLRKLDPIAALPPVKP